jgi:hypothetical protein
MFTPLQLLLERLEELKVHVGQVIWFTISQLVSSDQRVQPGLDHLLQLPHSGKVGVLPFLLLTVKNFLTIHVNF